MPIYEFYCADCHAVYQFLSRRFDTESQPDCPECGRAKLERQLSMFAISKNRKDPATEDDFGDLGDVDEAKLMKAMESLSHEADGMNEDDPRQMATLVRKLYDAAGMDVGPGMEEAMNRLESGEDPDAIEEEMGEQLDAEGDQLFKPGGAKKAIGTIRKKLPPRKPLKLYEM